VFHTDPAEHDRKPGTVCAGLAASYGRSSEAPWRKQRTAQGRRRELWIGRSPIGGEQQRLSSRLQATALPPYPSLCVPLCDPAMIGHVWCGRGGAPRVQLLRSRLLARVQPVQRALRGDALRLRRCHR